MSVPPVRERLRPHHHLHCSEFGPHATDVDHKFLPALTNWKPEGDFPHVPTEIRSKRSSARASMDFSFLIPIPRS